MPEVTDDDAAILDALIVAIRRLVPLAKDGETLAGLGEVWASLTSMVNGGSTDYANTLTLSIERGDDDFNESLSAVIEISDEGVELARSRHVYSGDVGGDNEYTVLTRLDDGNGFNQDRVFAWMSLFEDLEKAEDAKLEVERHHV